MASPWGVAFAAGVGSVAGAMIGAVAVEAFGGRLSEQAKGGTLLLISAVGAGVGGALATPSAAAGSTTAAGMGRIGRPMSRPLALPRGLNQLSPQ